MSYLWQIPLYISVTQRAQEQQNNNKTKQKKKNLCLPHIFMPKFLIMSFLRWIILLYHTFTQYRVWTVKFISSTEKNSSFFLAVENNIRESMMKNMFLLSYPNSPHIWKRMCSNQGILFSLRFSCFRYHPKGLFPVTIFSVEIQTCIWL